MCVVLLKYTATTGCYTYGHTLSLHDALPIYPRPCTSTSKRWVTPPVTTTASPAVSGRRAVPCSTLTVLDGWGTIALVNATAGGKSHRKDRKSTRLNSSH